MVNFVHSLIVLAEVNRYQNMGNRFRGRRAQFDTGDLVTGLLILVGVGIGIFVLSRFLSRQDRRRAFNSPRALFHELCKVHGLDRPSRKLLRQVARWQRLAQPARLFLEPDRFDPANLSPQLEARLEEVQKVRDRVFAQTIDDDAPPARRKLAAASKRRAPASRKTVDAEKDSPAESSDLAKTSLA